MSDQSPPCGWEPLECGELPPSDGENYEPLLAASSEVLWNLSGRRYGCCERTVWPCGQAAFSSFWSSYPCSDPTGLWTPVLSDGEWTNVFCRSHGRRCSCAATSEVLLPGPICEVIEVTEDGEVVPTGSYRLDDGGWLVRQDGGKWPTCQDLSVAPGSVGTWSVKISDGEPVPSAGRYALGELMSQLWGACRDDDKCKLPQRIRFITRQGVSIPIMDLMDFLKSGKTGLYFCDLWLSSVNPQARPQRARIVSPDYDPPGRTSWTP